jgi:putative endonuclease
MAATKTFYVYIMASKRNGTLYVGMTSNLVQRVYQHKNGIFEGFTKNYEVHNLVYFETTDSALAAIKREKQIKKWNRPWKINLIEKTNRDWLDLYPEIIGTTQRDQNL